MDFYGPLSTETWETKLNQAAGAPMAIPLGAEGLDSGNRGLSCGYVITVDCHIPPLQHMKTDFSK